MTDKQKAIAKQLYRLFGWQVTYPLELSLARGRCSRNGHRWLEGVCMVCEIQVQNS